MRERLNSILVGCVLLFFTAPTASFAEIPQRRATFVNISYALDSFDPNLNTTYQGNPIDFTAIYDFLEPEAIQYANRELEKTLGIALRFHPVEYRGYGSLTEASFGLADGSLEWFWKNVMRGDRPSGSPVTGIALAARNANSSDAKQGFYVGRSLSCEDKAALVSVAYVKGEDLKYNLLSVVSDLGRNSSFFDSLDCFRKKFGEYALPPERITLSSRQKGALTTVAFRVTNRGGNECVYNVELSLTPTFARSIIADYVQPYVGKWTSTFTMSGYPKSSKKVFIRSRYSCRGPQPEGLVSVNSNVASFTIAGAPKKKKIKVLRDSAFLKAVGSAIENAAKTTL